MSLWFSGKPKNRRLGREYVLDVKLRSSQVRSARLRFTVISFGVLFAIVFGTYLLWRVGEWGLNQLVYQNKAFAIEELDVQSDGIIAPDQLRRWTGVRLGQNLLALDLARVRRDLLLVSMLQSVSVERVLPHTLRVRVTEREPLAQINLLKPAPGGGVEMAVFYLDAEGYVIVPLDPRERTAPLNQTTDQLPVISGLNGNQLQAGRHIEAPQLVGALELLSAFEHSPMQPLVDLKIINVSASEVLVVTTGQGSEITFGLKDLDQQLRRWRTIFTLAQQANKAIGTLDLAVTNNLPARFVEASAVPASTPKAPKLPKKKHV